MTEPHHLRLTRSRYDAMSVEYEEFIRTVMDEQHLDRAMVLAFAAMVRESGNATVVDVGCGPGHITDLLAGAGLDARGIDVAPGMVALARRRRPDLRFDVGSLLALDLPDGQMGGVLAHYSVIHTPPDELPGGLAELVRVLAPGGYLLLSFQSGDDSLTSWVAFDHRVAPAYRWSMAAVVGLVTAAGLVECARLREVPDSHQRFHAGHVLARKPPVAPPVAPPGER